MSPLLVFAKTFYRSFLASILCLGVLLLASHTNPALAANTLHVKPTATGSGDCSTWANACTLQAALGAAASGDEIWVTQGVYKPTARLDPADPRSVTFWLKTGVGVYGGFAGTETALDQRDITANPTILSGDLAGDDQSGGSNAENAYHVVLGDSTDATAVLDGFTISGGNANDVSFPHNSGGGMYNGTGNPTLTDVNFVSNSASLIGGGIFNSSSSPTLTNVTFSGNSAGTDGGGIYCQNGSPTLTNVTFSGNSAGTNGGGMNCHNGSPMLTHVTFSGNSATGRGGGMYNEAYGSPVLADVTFSDNKAKEGGGMFNKPNSSPSLSSVTFSGNSSIGFGGGGMYNQGSSPTLTNVTFSGNSSSYGGGMYNEGSAPTLTNVTFSGNSVTLVGGGMYNSASSSPTLTNVIIANSTNGGDCVNDGTSTIDAASSHNLIEDSANACGLTNGVNGNLIGSDPTLGALADNGGATHTHTHALLAGSLAIDAGTNNGCPSSDQRGMTRPVGATCDIGAFELYAGVYHVKPAATGNMDCQSWADACTLQFALKASAAGDEAWVAAGTYTPHASDRTISFILKTGVAVYGGFAGTETLRSQRDIAANPTILSGDLAGDDSANVDPSESTRAENTYHVVVGSGTDATTVLDGFTITGGNANVIAHYDGGGMLNQSGSPTLANLTFSSNSATSNGAGMYNSASSPTLTDVTFSNNSAAGNGAGMANYFSSGPTLTSVNFSGNSATGGGGMFNSASSPMLLFVTFSGNSASSGGGGMGNGFSSSPMLTNVTFSGNSAPSGGGMYNGGSGVSPTLTKVTFSSNSADYGGGMVNRSNGSTLLANVSFSGNMATKAGGGMFNEDSSPTLISVIFSGNSAANEGGGLNNASGSDPTLTDVTFSGNSATWGGGMGNISSSPTVSNVTFSSNAATNNGGGMFNDLGSSPALTDVTFSSNSAGAGGGMYSISSSPTLTNVTFSTNSATNEGGGMYSSYGNPLLTNVTFSGNSANSGGGMYNYLSGSPTLTNVIIANSGSGGDCVNAASGTLNGASSHNLIEESANACGLANGVNGNIIGSDPNLGPLADNGGATQTHALLSGSPAIDAGTNSGCPASDQRGMTRPVGAICDIGAFELYAGVYHVKPAATGNMDCQSWTDACTLGFALKASAAGDEVWVAAGTYTPDASDLRASCQDIRAANPTAADGDYAINANGNVFTVYCYDMAGTPREYLTLLYTGTDQNFSQYTAGGASPGADVRTRYDKIRLDPANLVVDISDQTFAQSTGQLSHSGQVQVTSMSFAIAMDCVSSVSDLGLANIDLRGTPFTVADTFEGNGFQYNGSATKSANDQVVDITGGGFCGWWAPVPVPSMAYNQLPPSFTLELNYIGTGREVSFHLRIGVALYGGFAGTETLRSQRDIAANPTILSGDLAGDDNGNVDPNEPTRAENAYHVVVGNGTDATAVLDGFTISGGNANGASSPHDRGGGMLNQTGSPTLTNITFSANSASRGGGGLRNEASSPTLENVTFSGNLALGGGGMNNDSSSPMLTNVTFSGNSASGGGGMYDFASSPTLTNVTFSGNSASSGGGMLNYDSNPTLTNVTFSGNSASSGGGMYNTTDSGPTLINVIIANSNNGGDCVNNGTSTLDAASNHNLIEDGANTCGLTNGPNGNLIGSDPNLGPLADNGGATQTHALLPGSPAIDAGTNSNCPATDQRGVPRPQGSACDIGAYEIGANEAQIQIFLPLIQH